MADRTARPQRPAPVKTYTASGMTRWQLVRVTRWLEAEGYNPNRVYAVRPVNKRQVWVRQYDTNEFGGIKVTGGDPVYLPDELHEARTRFPLAV